jgi:hypothetical protein
MATAREPLTVERGSLWEDQHPQRKARGRMIEVVRVFRSEGRAQVVDLRNGRKTFVKIGTLAAGRRYRYLGSR